jgi:hypothetical protein
MQRTLFGFMGMIAVLALAAPAVAADTVDNPQYKEWAKWREGAFATLKTEAVVDGTVQVVTTQTQTLKKLTAEKAVIEMTSITEAAGQKIDAPPMTFDIPAKGPKIDLSGFTGANVDPKDVPKYKETKGKESLTIKGKKLDCEWHQIEVAGAVTMTWYCDQVPGRMVKAESRVMGNSTVMQLTDWKAEKK